MKLKNHAAQIFIPDGIPEEEALSRTTDLCIAAHQDDIEIMAFAPIARPVVYRRCGDGRGRLAPDGRLCRLYR